MPRLLLFILLFGFASFAVADNWPSWRGATGQGHCAEKNVPLKWSDKENVVWKIDLADHGNSTPVVWKDRIFLTQANKGGTVRSLICFDRKDGNRLWQKDVEYKEAEKNWDPKWYCNASPTTDGERVVVCFGSAGVYCYDFAGKEVWSRTDLGTWEHQYGNGASPVLYGDTVIQWCGPNEKTGRNVLIAMNKATGKTVWEHDEKEGSWATPVVVTADGKDQLVFGVGPHLKAFDPKAGKELWKCDGLQSYVYTSALIGNGVAVGMSGYGKSSIAVKLGGTGDITKDRLWRHEKPANQRVGSGVIVGEHVYVIDDDGSPRCYELTTGKNLWDGEVKLKGPTWGSMVHADGRLYTLMRDGTTVVLAAKPKYDILATNKLSPGEQTNSSVAISDGQIFLRTTKHLWCVGEKK